MKLRVSNLPEVIRLLRAGAGVSSAVCLTSDSPFLTTGLVWPLTLSRPGLNHGSDCFHVTSVSRPLKESLWYQLHRISFRQMSIQYVISHLSCGSNAVNRLYFYCCKINTINKTSH